MSEYVFRDAPGFGCDMSELMDGSRKTVGDYFASNAADHFGTLHEEIVRCRDCRHFDNRLSYPLCRRDMSCDELAVYAEPNGFCAWGERREQ